MGECSNIDFTMSQFLTTMSFLNKCEEEALQRIFVDMLRTVPPSLADTKAICTSFDVRRDVRCIATHSSQKYAALGCHSDLKIIRIDSAATCTMGDIFTLPNSVNNSIISDVSWNPIESNKLAVSYATGQLRVYNFVEKAAKPTDHLTAAWNGVISGVGINRVTWHPQEEFLLATANSDGTIKFFDIREKTNTKPTLSFRGKGITGQTRDVKFNLFSSHYFADASESGRFRIWDRRNVNAPMMSNDAHKNKVLCLAWSPLSEWKIATGSADKTVKVWDSGSCRLDFGSDVSSIPSTSVHGGIPPASAHGGPLPAAIEICTLFTPGEVGKIMWAYGDNIYDPNNTSTGTKEYIVTTNTPSQASSESNGYISIWNVQHTHVPVVLLKGHGSELCSSMDWIECTTASPSSPQMQSLLSSPPMSGTNSMYPMGGNMSVKLKKGAASAVATPVLNPKIATKSTPTSLLDSSNHGGSANSSSATKRSSFSTNKINTQQPLAMVLGTVPCIISGGRDGKLLIQNPYIGFFPYQHMTGCLMAISSQGHAAFHRGKIAVDCLSLPSRLYTNSISSLGSNANYSGSNNAASGTNTNAAGTSNLYSTPTSKIMSGGANNSASNATHSLTLQPTTPSVSDFSAVFSSPSTNATSTTTPIVASSISNYNVATSYATNNFSDFMSSQSQQHQSQIMVTGGVFVGLANFPTLQDAMRVRHERSGGAEASVFDPALMYLLAKHYSFGKTINYKTLNMNADEEHEFIVKALQEYCAYEPPSVPQNMSTATLATTESYTPRDVSIDAADEDALEFDLRRQKEEQIRTGTKQLSDDMLVMYYNIMDACQTNQQIANIAGLKCRAAIWSSLLALIPFPLHQKNANKSLLPFATPSKSFPVLPVAPTSLSTITFSSQVNLSMPLPFTQQLLANLLNELLEGGDAQHFVVMCEILRRMKLLATITTLAQIPPIRTRTIYMAYIDLLHKQELFVEANEIIKSSNDENIALLSQRDVDIALKCNQCKREVPRRSSMRAFCSGDSIANIGINSADEDEGCDLRLKYLSASGYAKSTPVRCEQCKLCVSICGYCHLPVTGMVQWCPICAHGGHFECMKKWFSLETCCPTGCNHHCCPATIVLPLDPHTTLLPSPVESMFQKQTMRANRQRGRMHRTQLTSSINFEDNQLADMYQTDYLEYALTKRRKNLKYIRRQQISEILYET